MGDPRKYETMMESEVADIYNRCAACQSLDGDTHGKIVRLVEAYREAVEDLGKANDTIKSLRSAASKKATAKSKETAKKATKKKATKKKATKKKATKK